MGDFYTPDPTLDSFSGDSLDFMNWDTGSADPGSPAGPLDVTTSQLDINSLWDSGQSGQGLSGVTDPAPDTTGTSFNVDPTVAIPGVGMSVNELQNAGYTSEQIDALLGQQIGTSGMTLADATNYGYTDQGVAALFGNSDVAGSSSGNDNTNLVPMGPSGGSGSAGKTPANGPGASTGPMGGSRPVNQATASQADAILASLQKLGTSLTSMFKASPTLSTSIIGSKAKTNGTGTTLSTANIAGSNPEILLIMAIAAAFVAAIFWSKGKA